MRLDAQENLSNPVLDFHYLTSEFVRRQDFSWRFDTFSRAKGLRNKGSTTRGSAARGRQVGWELLP